MFQTCVTCSSASLGSEVIDPRTECSTAKILPEVISVVGHGGHGGQPILWGTIPQYQHVD